MKNLGYYNGKMGLIEEMEVPMTDRAFYFGDGVYDAVMCRNNIPYLLDEHIDRFFLNCDRLQIKIPVIKSELCDLIFTLVKKVDGEEKFVYFQASRGNGLREHSFSPSLGSLCIMIIPQKVGDLSAEYNVILAEDIRYGLCDIKTLNLLPNILASHRARTLECDEAIFHRDGIVTEGTHCNVSIISKNQIITAPTDCHILPGVTRAHMLEAAKQLSIPVFERKYSVKELFEADEILISSSSKLIRRVGKIDGKRVGGKNPEILNLIQKSLFSKYVDATN